MTNIPAIISVSSAEERLALLEQEAASALKLSDAAFNRGMLALWTIKTELHSGKPLWQYAVDDDNVMFMDRKEPVFEDYLYLFCRDNHISRSGTLDHIKTIRVWVEALHLDPDLLLTAGVKRVKPIRNLVNIDGRTGQVSLPEPEIVARISGATVEQACGLSTQETVDAVVSYAVEKLIQPQEPLTASDVRKAFTVDIGHDQYSYIETKDGNIDCVYESHDESWRGTIVRTDELLEKGVPKHVIDNLFRRIKPIRRDGVQ